MEFVYVVPRREIFPDCYPQGFHPFGRERSADAFEASLRREGFFVEREHAERTPSLKQVIPYTVMLCQGEVLVLRRLKTGGERRLHDKLSIGVGGHVNPRDASPTGDPIRAGALREIAEELDVRGSYELSPIGFLNDDSNPVGAVHLGWVQLARVQGSIEIRETDQLEGRMASVGELQDLLGRGENFETWSAILIERLGELLPNSETVVAES